MKASSAERVLAPLPAVDDDLEAANFAFDSPARVAALPFRFPVDDLRSPLAAAVRKLLENPAAVTVDGIPRSELVVDRLVEAGTPLSDADRRELLAIPLSIIDSRGPRCAAKVRRGGLLRRKAELARRLAEDPDDVGLRREDRKVLDELDAIAAFLADPDAQNGASASISAAILSGDVLRALTDREPIQPVAPGIPPKGHLAVRVGASFAGKTTLDLWVAMARAAGVAPWQGAPELERGTTLLISPDEPAEQIARQIRRLSLTHPGGRAFDYFGSIAVLALDSSIPMDALHGLRFNDAGFALLDDLLARGFSAMTIDAYADMLPTGASEQENEVAARIGGALEALAVKHAIPITLIHHVGKLGGLKTSDVDVRDLGRGASALAAKARTVFTFEEVEGFANHRRIRTRTNLTRSPAPLELLVTERDTGGSAIEFFRPVDPATAWPIVDVLPEVPSDWISTSELARRLSGHEDGKPTGPAMKRAAEVREIWRGAGLAEVRPGAKRALELRRIR